MNEYHHQPGLGRSPSRNRIWCIFASKYDIWWQQFPIIFLRMKWPNLVQFSIQLDVLGIFLAVVVTVPVSLPEWENDFIFSKRQACRPIQSEVGPHKSSYGFWGSAISSQQGPGRNQWTTAKIKHLKHFHDIGEPRFIQRREFTGYGSRIF